MYFSIRFFNAISRVDSYADLFAKAVRFVREGGAGRRVARLHILLDYVAPRRNGASWV